MSNAVTAIVLPNQTSSSHASSDIGASCFVAALYLDAYTILLSPGLSSPLTTAAFRPKDINLLPNPAMATINLLRNNSTHIRYDRCSFTQRYVEEHPEMLRILQLLTRQ